MTVTAQPWLKNPCLWETPLSGAVWGSKGYVFPSSISLSRPIPESQIGKRKYQNSWASLLNVGHWVKPPWFQRDKDLVWRLGAEGAWEQPFSTGFDPVKTKPGNSLCGSDGRGAGWVGLKVLRPHLWLSSKSVTPRTFTEGWTFHKGVHSIRCLLNKQTLSGTLRFSWKT